MVRPNQHPHTSHQPAASQAGAHPLRQRPAWQHAQAVTLLRNVLRLTAPNPGVMTGPGTNSYLVGEPHTGYLVIDPGPNEPAHIERLWQATGGDIRAIICTHSHADHAPAARPLQALCAQRGAGPHPGHLPAGEGVKNLQPALRPLSAGEDASNSSPVVLPRPLGAGRGQGTPPILGLPSAASARPASHFTPDHTLAHDARLCLRADDGLSHTLQIIHTPGHAANHLCLLLVEDGLLFSGDHILSGSTTVIDPPDGDMTAYLDSLDLLSAACAQHAVEFILPAHGHVLDEASGTIARLKAHRLQREAKILRAMQAQPQGTPDDWLPEAYDDVPAALWPLAMRSLLAHVQRLQTLNPNITP